MGTAQRDLSLDSIEDATKEEKDEALKIVLEMLAKQGTFPEWVKEPPEWWISMYLLDPGLVWQRDQIAFERIPSRPGWYKALHPLLFHHMMIIGRIDDVVGYEDRWCFQDFKCGLEAFNAWDGAEGTEPEGWHKHPHSGRTRKKMPDGTWLDTTGKIGGIDY
jgi:hypothetical protein